MVKEGRRLGVGVIGLGVGMAHISSFSSSSRTKVQAICDVDSARCSVAQKLVPDAVVSRDWHEVVTSPDVDIVVVATPDSLHAEMIDFAIQNKKHVFAEKPICIAASELDQISVSLRRNPDSVFSANMVLRANPALLELRREIAGGSMGVVTHLEASYLYGRFNKIADGWRGGQPRYSAMLGGGIHMLDLSFWLLGERPLSVVGIGHSIASTSRGHPIDDFELAVLKFPSGKTATVTAVMATAVPHSHAVTVHGTQQTFLMGPIGYQYVSSDGKAGTSLKDVPKKFDRSSIALSFVDQILGLGQARVNAQEVLECTAVALAIRESITSSSEVFVRYP